MFLKETINKNISKKEVNEIYKNDKGKGKRVGKGP